LKIDKKIFNQIQQGFALGGYDPDLAIPFVKKIRKMGTNLGYQNPDEFTSQTLNLMRLECGFNPTAVNTLGYKGLIQFSPRNAQVFGFTPDPIKQLDAVEAYLKSNKRAIEQTHGKAVIDRDASENGSILLTSVFTGPAAASLRDPSAARVSDKYGTSNASYYKNIRSNTKQVTGNPPPIDPTQESVYNNLALTSPAGSPQVADVPESEEYSTLQDQFKGFDVAKMQANQQASQPQGPSDSVMEEVIKLMQQQGQTNQQMATQAQDDRLNSFNQQQGLQQQLLDQQKQFNEKELARKAEEVQRNIDTQKQTALQAAFKAETPVVPMPQVAYRAPQVDFRGLSGLIAPEEKAFTNQMTI
jgi:hypothetical protein